jgi:hypothetical protein
MFLRRYPPQPPYASHAVEDLHQRLARASFSPSRAPSSPAPSTPPSPVRRRHGTSDDGLRVLSTGRCGARLRPRVSRPPPQSGIVLPFCRGGHSCHRRRRTASSSPHKPEARSRFVPREARRSSLPGVRRGRESPRRDGTSANGGSCDRLSSAHPPARQPQARAPLRQTKSPPTAHDSIFGATLATSSLGVFLLGFTRPALSPLAVGFGRTPRVSCEGLHLRGAPACPSPTSS